MPKEETDNGEKVQPRPFWSGIVAFGLVSLPVSLFPANRGKAFHLKMVDDDGTPLKRRFFCEQEDKALEREEIVRGYEVDDGRFVTVEDEELEALAPEKSREIDLKRFVSLSDVNPIYFERAYFLVPDGGATKAYRLLARSMEDEQRAGIATFVMRGKEYLVAIIAERGILRAETLRFHDEVRSPEAIGLPERETADGDAVERMQAAMRKLRADRLEREQLEDTETQRILACVEKKLAENRDVVAAPEETVEEYEEESNVIDLMQVLKERLQGRAAAATTPPRNGGSRRDLEEQSKDELYELAKELDIPGRSNMSKRQLADAIRRH